MPVTNQPITLSRETDVVEVPSGINNKLPAGTVVRVMQNLGTTYTVYSDYGLMYRVDAKDADALGLSNAPAAPEASSESETFSEKMVWDQLKTVYDPEIPSDIYELGLIYSIDIDDSRFVNIDMTLTTPNCPSAAELPMQVENAVAGVVGVREAKVTIVWDPPWDPSRMSDEARTVLNMW